MPASIWWKDSSKSHHHQYAYSLLALLALPNALALEVVSGSNCSSSCLSTLTGYTTNGSDVACHDSDYNSTVYGGAFQDCVSCEIGSQEIDSQSGQSDLGWAFCRSICFPRPSHKGNANPMDFPVNMRYAVDWCLFDYPDPQNQTVSNACTSSCAPIAPALRTNILTPNASTTYDFCQDPNFLPNVGACASCYEIIPNQLYISNCESACFAHWTIILTP